MIIFYSKNGSNGQSSALSTGPEHASQINSLLGKSGKQQLFIRLKLYIKSLFRKLFSSLGLIYPTVQRQVYHFLFWGLFCSFCSSQSQNLSVESKGQRLLSLSMPVFLLLSVSLHPAGHSRLAFHWESGLLWGIYILKDFRHQCGRMYAYGLWVFVN